jgi:hypothetical protein
VSIKLPIPVPWLKATLAAVVVIAAVPVLLAAFMVLYPVDLIENAYYAMGELLKWTTDRGET